jgi:hypothetical protein
LSETSPYTDCFDVQTPRVDPSPGWNLTISSPAGCHPIFFASATSSFRLRTSNAKCMQPMSICLGFTVLFLGACGASVPYRKRRLERWLEKRSLAASAFSRHRVGSVQAILPFAFNQFHTKASRHLQHGDFIFNTVDSNYVLVRTDCVNVRLAGRHVRELFSVVCWTHWIDCFSNILEIGPSNLPCELHAEEELKAEKTFEEFQRLIQ